MRRSDFTAGSFDFPVADTERGVPPADLLKRVMQPLIDLADQGDWNGIIERYDRYSLLGWLMERGVSEGARAFLGPLFNLEGRFHFSLVEWFIHWHHDIFGDLEFITDGASTLPEAFGPLLLPNVRFGAAVTAIEQSPDGVSVQWRDRSGTRMSIAGDECIVTVPFNRLVHIEMNGLDVDQGVQPAQRLLRASAQDLPPVPAALVGRRGHHPRREHHRPRHPPGGLHAGRAGPERPARRAHRLLRLGAGLHDLEHDVRAGADHPGARGPRQDPSFGRRHVRDGLLPRLGPRRVRRWHRSAVPAVRDVERGIRRRHPPGRAPVVRQRRLRPALAGAGSRAAWRRRSRTPTPSTPACATSSPPPRTPEAA